MYCVLQVQTPERLRLCDVGVYREKGTCRLSLKPSEFCYQLCLLAPFSSRCVEAVSHEKERFPSPNDSFCVLTQDELCFSNLKTLRKTGSLSHGIIQTGKELRGKGKQLVSPMATLR